MERKRHVDRREFMRDAVSAVSLGGVAALSMYNLLDKTDDERLIETIERVSKNTCKIDSVDGHGSGVVINTKWGQFILTNFHVLEGKPYKNTDDDEIYKVSMFRKDDHVKPLTFRTAPVLLRNGERAWSSITEGDDLGLLKIPENTLDLEGLNLCNKRLKRGQRAIVIGNPMGEDSYVTTGRVTHTGTLMEDPRGKDWKNTELIMVDAPINGGNSGGPILNLDGDIIGLAAMSYRNSDGMSGGIKYTKIRDRINKWFSADTQD